jgi:8-oxo-dGTP diphosphatase
MSSRTRIYATIRLTVDIVVLTIRDDRLRLLLIERRNEPFRGKMALPGGFLSHGETLEDGALRELGEETGIAGERLHLEQLRTYGDVDRDPRGRLVTVAYLGIAPDLPEPAAGSDARAAEWLAIDDVLAGAPELAFDHRAIVDDALERARSKFEYTSLATAFCADEFTIADLRRVYEVVWGTRLDPGNFSRKVTRTDGFVVPTGAIRAGDTGRPPALYRRGGAVGLYPPMLRSTILASGAADQ